MSNPAEDSDRRKFLFGGAAVATIALAAGFGYAERERLKEIRRRILDIPPDYSRAQRNAFYAMAREIRTRQAKQSREQVAALKKKYQDPVFGKVRVWDLIERLSLCIDPSDDSLLLTSQYHHTQQILEGMEKSRITDKNLLLTALLHDTGKTILLNGEVPENVVGYTIPIGEFPKGIGADNLILQFGHGEFMYSRLHGQVPDEVAWSIRYHSTPLETLRPYLNETDQRYMQSTLSTFSGYDMGMKSVGHLPHVKMERYRAMIEDLFPNPILI